MSFDKYYPNRKDRRKPYYKSKRFDRSCRCHGNCQYCLSNRMYQYKKELLRVKEELELWYKEC